MERVSPQRHEYINGRIVARPGATKNHAEIISKLFGEIYNYPEDKPCRAYPAGLKVVTIGRESYTYPDMIIFCGDPILEDYMRDTVVSPGVIIEWWLEGQLILNGRMRKLMTGKLLFL